MSDVSALPDRLSPLQIHGRATRYGSCGTVSAMREGAATRRSGPRPRSAGGAPALDGFTIRTWLRAVQPFVSSSFERGYSSTLRRLRVYRLFTMQRVFGDADGVCDGVGVEYVSRVPRPPLDGLIDDLYYLEGALPTPG
ncbi:hypothetical protein ACGFNX_11120 [Streptomyces sp. NPDC048723]|uniref:hypothetical protein n=1 Tax=Streptomyces sp. NPDC048723 TaxID=3365589 RepID=UPI0037114CDE